MKRFLNSTTLLALAILGLGMLQDSVQAQTYGLRTDQQFSIGSPVYIAPTLTPVSTVAAGAGSLVLKSTGGDLFSLTVTNLTATAAVVMVQNSATAVTSGAVTPVLCVPLPASGVANINFAPGPPAAFSQGISVSVSTPATTCATVTLASGSFISGLVQ